MKALCDTLMNFNFAKTKAKRQGYRTAGKFEESALRNLCSSGAPRRVTLQEGVLLLHSCNTLQSFLLSLLLLLVVYPQARSHLFFVTGVGKTA